MSKTILLTGAERGAGRVVAETLSAAGHRVFAGMRDPLGRNSALANALWAQAIDVVGLDITDDASVERGVRDTLAKAGRIDVLINNGAIVASGVSEAFTTDQVRDLLDNNVIGVFRAMRATLPGMRREKGGLILNVGSIFGRVALPYFGVHATTMFALEALSDAFRYEASVFGIDAVLVQTGAFHVALDGHAQWPDDDERVKSFADAGRDPAVLEARFAALTADAEAREIFDLASVLAGLVDMPKGSRPDRVVVGASLGADGLNRLSRSIQGYALNELGLTELTHPDPSQA